jgi:hypothetical protein
MEPEFEAGVVRRRGWWVPNFGRFLYVFGSRMGDVEGVRGVSDGGGTDGAGFDPGGEEVVVVAGTRFAVSVAHFFARSARCVTTRVGEVWMVVEGRMARDVELGGMRRRQRCRVPVFGCLWPFFFKRSARKWVTPTLGRRVTGTGRKDKSVIRLR